MTMNKVAWVLGFALSACVAPDPSLQRVAPETAEQVGISSPIAEEPDVHATALEHSFASVKEEASAAYDNRCASCHGPVGYGDGDAVHVLIGQKARSLANREWQNSVSDADIAQAMSGQARFSLAHQSNKDLIDKPHLVSALVEQVRGFAQ